MTGGQGSEWGERNVGLVGELKRGTHACMLWPHNCSTATSRLDELAWAPGCITPPPTRQFCASRAQSNPHVHMLPDLSFLPMFVVARLGSHLTLATSSAAAQPAC